MRDAPPTIILASSLILYRATAGNGPPDLLLLERNRSLAFAGGALVFPGGRVDPGDRTLAANIDGTEDTAARVAAIRETIEEAGVAVGLDPHPDAATLVRLREGLASGLAFNLLLERERLALAPERLFPLSRWRPPAGLASRTFDTRFYLAYAPADAEAEPDGGEMAAARWASARTLIADYELGRVRLLFPTLCHLHRIAGHADFADAVADSQCYPTDLIIPAREVIDGQSWVTIPTDRGYPFTRQLTDTILVGADRAKEQVAIGGGAEEDGAMPLPPQTASPFR